MLLQRGEVLSYTFNRMAVEFTMVNQGKVIPCSISTAAMDDLEGRRDVKSDQLPPSERTSKRILRPSVQPNSCMPCRKALVRTCVSGSPRDVVMSTPMRRIRSVC